MSDDEILLQAKRFRVIRRTFRTADGQQRQLDFASHPGAVTIVPLVTDSRVCLIRNVRPAVGQTLLELPAGTLEPGEDPLETARRELTEETGYVAQRLEKLAEFFMSPGILNERMYVFVAHGLNQGQRDLDEGEQIENEVVDWDEAMRRARSGEIQDAKTLAALLLWNGRRST